MKRQAIKINYIIAAVFAAVVFIFSLAGSGAGYNRTAASAAVSETVTKYENSNVWNDLQGAKIDGEGIDLSIYNFDEKKNLQIISFIEFCYSPFENKQSDFGLYVYVYNPRGLDFTSKSAMNKIQIRCTGKTTSHSNKYGLQVLNKSTQAGYEGLFYKFKIVLSAEEKKSILTALNSSSRVYEVAEIELYSSGTNATAYNISNVYTYTGFAKGYGSAAATEDTLSCQSDGMDLTLTLDVHSAVYRPEYSNGKNEYTQDMLYSVYFSIPNEIINEYGGISAVHATWLNAKTAPMFVTGNKTIYDALYDSVWKNLGRATSDLNYCLLANGVNIGIDGPEYVGDFCYHDYKNPSHSVFQNMPNHTVTPDISRLYYLFYAENGNADDYVLSGAQILQYLNDYTQALINNDMLITGDSSAIWTYVLDKYASWLFQSVDEKFTDKTITADDKYDLKSEKLTQSFWEKVFGLKGTEVEVSETFRNIEAIHEVKASDFKSDTVSTCKGLYIEESYYSDFKKFYDSATDREETVYLFRYYYNDYVCREATEFKYATHWGIKDAYIDKVDTNAYFAEQWLTLDFDIIDVTCRKGNVKTVIPCIVSPIDVIPDVTPPLVTTPDDEKTFWEWLYNELFVKKTWWVWLITVVFVLTTLSLAIKVLSIFVPIFKPVWNGIVSVLKWLCAGVWWFLSAPFRGIAALFKRLKERGAERKKRKEQLRQEKLRIKERAKLESYQNKLDSKESRRLDKQAAKKERSKVKAREKARKKRGQNSRSKNKEQAQNAKTDKGRRKSKKK